MHQRDVWYNRLRGLRQRTDRLKGHEAYCEEKMFHWEEFARVADFQIPISQRSGALLSLRHSMCSLMCSLMSIESHVY